MNILLISPLPPPSGGIATWTQSYINSETARNNYVRVVNTAIRGNRANNLAKMSLWDEIKRVKDICSDIKNVLQNEKFDAAHLNTSCSGYGMARDILCAKLVKRKNIRLVLQCHCDTSFMAKSRAGMLIFRKLCELSDVILCLNRASQDHIKAVTGRNSHIIPNFADVRRLAGNMDRKVSDSIKTVIFAGHITMAKGCDDIIKVAERLPHIIFKLIGYISDEIKALPVPDNVRFTGEMNREEVIREMREADLFLIPSHTEGFPNVVLEAMACGLPVIATPVGAIPEMIEDKGGVLVGTGDTDGIVAAISSLEDAGRRKDMSGWNMNKAVTSYSTEAVLEKVFRIYSG